MSKMDKLIESKKKEGKSLPEHEQKAKLGVMEDLHKMASDAMGGKVAGLKKVTVASDSPEGLSHGLDKAKQIMSGNEMQHGVEDAESGTDRGDSIFAGGEDSEGESSQDEMAESPAEQHAEDAAPGEHEDKYAHMSEAELDHQLKCLMDAKKKLHK